MFSPDRGGQTLWKISCRSKHAKKMLIKTQTERGTKGLSLKAGAVSKYYPVAE